MTALTRAALAAAGEASTPLPVRIVHLGLGAFHRAHQAWYTQHAGDGWGIAAFTGRSPRAAETLTAQDGLYALVARGAEADEVEIITSISEARDGADLSRLCALMADPAVAVITLTITEAGYHLGPDGELDRADPAVRADIEALRAACREAGGSAAPTTPLGRLVFGLAARRAAEAGPIAVVSCDNIPANGSATGRAVLALAGEVDEGLARWARDNVSFVSTSVDRITPAHHGPVEAVAAAGWDDEATVVAEPFADWVLAGDFPAGRPAWERAGARFVDEIDGWEDRKLWLLNGAHTILVAAGMPAGHTTVDEAIADPACRRLVEDFWAEAVTCLPDQVEHVDYRRRLIERFENPRIVHSLAQIAAQSCAKARYRLVPVARRRLQSGQDASAGAAALAAWIGWASRGTGADVPDRERDRIEQARADADPVGALLRLLSPALADDPGFADRVRGLVEASTLRVHPIA